jgi:hypothetical protein
MKAFCAPRPARSNSHSESLEVGVGVFDAFTEAELLAIEGIDGETACVGWVLHHGYTG